MRLHVSRTLGSLVLALTLAACGGGGDAGSAPIPTGTVVLSEGTFASHNGSFVGESRSTTAINTGSTPYIVTIDANSGSAVARVAYNPDGSLVAISINVDPVNGDANYLCDNVSASQPDCPSGVELDVANGIVRLNNVLLQEEDLDARTIKLNGSLVWQPPV